MAKFWCWLFGHKAYSTGMGATHCERCLRRLP